MMQAVIQDDWKKIDSLYDIGKNDEYIIFYEERIVLAVFLGRYDELFQWINSVNTPDFERGLLGYEPVLESLQVAGKDGKELFNIFEERIRRFFPAGESSEFIMIFLHSRKFKPGAGRAEYNHMVLDFMKKYPDSRFNGYIGTILNAELATIGKVYGWNAAIGMMHIQRSGIPADHWEPGIISSAATRVFGKNYLSCSALTSMYISEVPQHIAETDLYTRSYYQRGVIRYDRCIPFSRRYDLLVFGDYGLALNTFSGNKGTDLDTRIDGYGTFSSGLKFNWNYKIIQEALHVDNLTDVGKRSLGLEVSYIRNLTNNYRGMFLISLQIGGINTKLYLRRNSGLK